MIISKILTYILIPTEQSVIILGMRQASVEKRNKIKDCFQEYSRRMIQLGRDHRDKILVHEQFLATKKSRKIGKILLSRYGMIGFLT